MLYSMTGYGRYELSRESKKITIEIKSVNHRYLDLNIRMPRKFNCFETDIRAELKKFMIRGKVDVYISYEDSESAATGLRYNKELAGAYLGFMKEMERDFSLRSDVPITAAVLARFPEILSMDEVSEDEDSLWLLLKEAIDEAGKRFADAREKEGRALAKDLIEKLDTMALNIDEVEKRFPEITKEYETKLRTKLDEFLQNQIIDESRIAAELVLFSDKLCTDEEIVRLRNHVVTMKQVLTQGGEAGRRLDFMAQEMNREANTILSKANDFRTSEIGISLKTTIEKIREQIQNIE